MCCFIQYIVLYASFCAPYMAQAQQYLDYMYEEVSVSLYGTNSSSDSEFIEKSLKH